MQGATLEALIAAHPIGRAAALLQQRAYKVKGREGMALRQRIITLEDQATGTCSSSLLYLLCSNNEAGLNLLVPHCSSSSSHATQGHMQNS